MVPFRQPAPCCLRQKGVSCGVPPCLHAAEQAGETTRPEAPRMLNLETFGRVILVVEATMKTYRSGDLVRVTLEGRTAIATVFASANGRSLLLKLEGPFPGSNVRRIAVVWTEEGWREIFHARAVKIRPAEHS
jgi:hypothetical protein